jgi:signal peptidase I
MGSHVQAGALNFFVRGARPRDADVSLRRRSLGERPLRERADPLLAAILFALFARTFLFQAFEVPSPSMEKTVLTGDRLLVNKFVYAPRSLDPLVRLLPTRAPRRGDVIVFKFPEDPRRDFIKRIVGLPGETVAIRDKTVLVNGRSMEEPYVFHSDDRVWPDDPSVPEEGRRRDQLPPQRVPADSYFVLGDNRDTSGDSRFWGFLPAGNLSGRALLVYWSCEPRSSGDPVGWRAAIRWPIEILRRTRWSRWFLAVR